MARGLSTAVPVVRRNEFEQAVLSEEGPVLAELSARDANYPHFTRAVQETLAQEAPEVKFVRVEVDEYRDLFDKYQENKGYHAYNFEKLPGAVLFRNGNVVTTFNPTFSSLDAKVQYIDVKRQLRWFIGKFIKYDPEKVTFNHKK